MKRVQALGIGTVVAMISTGAWLGCSSSSSNSSSNDTNDSGGVKSDAAVDTGSTTGDAGIDSGVDGGGVDSGSVDSGGDVEVEAGPVTFAEVWTDVVDKHCITCHSPNPDGGTAGGGLRIGKLDMSTPDAGYANLVNQPAQGIASIVDGGVACDTLAEAGVAGSIRVVPGDAGASLLYLKCNGFTTPPPCSSPMPANGEIPDGGQAAAVKEIQAWINGGALP
jgi:hypothetical protein